MQLPTLRQLEYIVAVAEEGHFGRAAQRCAVSQPALSKQIAEVEAVLGVQLFERSRPQLRVTVEGGPLVEQARRVLMAARELGYMAHQTRGGLAGPVKLGCIPTLAPYVLPGLIGALREELPDGVMTLVEGKTESLLLGLRAGRLDVVLLALPVEVGEGLEVLEVWEDPFVLAMPRGHRLATESGPLALSALAGEELLLLEEGHCFRSHALEVCARTSSQASWIAASSMTTLTLMVQQGLGVTLLPQCALGVELGRAQELVIRPFKAPAPRRRVGLCWRGGSALTHIIEAMARALREHPASASTHHQIAGLAHALADPIYRASASGPDGERAWDSPVQG